MYHNVDYQRSAELHYNASSTYVQDTCYSIKIREGDYRDYFKLKSTLNADGNDNYPGIFLDIIDIFRNEFVPRMNTACEKAMETFTKSTTDSDGTIGLGCTTCPHSLSLQVLFEEDRIADNIADTLHHHVWTKLGIMQVCSYLITHSIATVYLGNFNFFCPLGILY